MSDVISLASKLIQCGNDEKSNAAVQSLLSEALAQHKAETSSIQAGGTEHSLTLLGENGPCLLFLGHSDVVSTGDESLWEHPPFSGHYDSEFLYGRGAVDMRGSDAAFVTALNNVWPKVKDKIKVGIAIPGDEETKATGAPALIELLASKNEKVSLCLVGEPSAEQAAGDRVRIGRRGSLSAKVKFTGAQAHTAYVASEANVLHTAITAADKLAAISWQSDGAPWPDVSFHIVYFDSGTGEMNVVPGSAGFNFNIRFGPSLDKQSIISRCEEVLNKENFPYEIEWSKGCVPYFTKDRQSIELVKRAVQSIHGKEPKEAVDGGSSDGRFFANAGIPTVELGTQAKTLHQRNELVPVAELEKLVTLFEATILEFANSAADFA